MTQRRRSLLFLGLVIGLLAASVVAIALKPTVLGLDLKGGSRLLYQAVPSAEVPNPGPADIDRTISVIDRRVNAFGVAEPEIQREGTDQISIALAGVTDPQQLEDLVKPAQMNFFDYELSVVNTLTGVDASDRYAVFVAASKLAPLDIQGKKPTYYLFGPAPGRALLVGPSQSKADLTDAFRRLPVIKDQPKPKLADTETIALPAGYLPVTRNPINSADYDASFPTSYLIFRDTPTVPGSDFVGAQPVVQSGQTDVQLDFTDAGDKKFEKLTSTLWSRGNLRGEEQHFAAVLDGDLISEPRIDFRDNQLEGGISGGGVIQGNFSLDTAQKLSKQLSAGAIPVTLQKLSGETVSASLGKAALRKALIAGFIGLAAVMIFMVLYYRVLGLIADLALVTYGVLFYAVIELVPITMTLPGIAGMVLTIGVAADANVVIFERIREESRLGRAPRTAVLNGFKKGLSAIIDANVVTLITAAIIFILATSGPKGFAFTLFVGVLLSLFTAVLATRAVFETMADTKLFQNDAVMGLNQREIKWKFDFVGKWRLWLAISFVPLLAGTILMSTKGIERGIDFTGGSVIETTYGGKALPSEQKVRDVVAGAGITNPKIVQTTNADTKESGFTIQTKSLEAGESTRLQRSLESELGATIAQNKDVGPTFGTQIVRRALFAILLSFAVIILYLTLRFEMKLALPALASVIHDVWLALSIYSLTGREVTSATVAALLTILGYSLYDVVIVFDRIRENAPNMRNFSYREIVNRSVHETLTRSIITSILTLAPVAILYFTGGAALGDFSFALLVGILSGGISSILISAPLAALWKERDPQGQKLAAKARRRVVRESAVDSDILDVAALARAEAALAMEPTDLAADETIGLDVAPQPSPERPGPPEVALNPPSDPDGEARLDAPPERERRHRQVQRKRKK